MHAKADRPTDLTLGQFLEGADQFRLGQLPTEQPHPKTVGLSELARRDPPRAAQVLFGVDLDAIDVLREEAQRIAELRGDLNDTLAAGQRVFLCGCGATGRLALSLETFWRQTQGDRAAVSDRVVALMAGGDTALIRSIEGFEDHESYGERHLKSLGFGPDDLLVSCTEGGETSYVIGATRYAAATSTRRPWFLYCNPDEALVQIRRSRATIEDTRVRCLSLPTGPMALSGSTRMQASTVLLLAVGLPLLQPDEDLSACLDRLATRLAAASTPAVAELVKRESAIYKAGEYVLYESNRHAITVLTDTTERAPTFNLSAFENIHDASPEASLCYLMIPGTDSPTVAWQRLLSRSPRPLSWPGFEAVAGAERLRGFDFSERGVGHRRQRLAGAPHQRFVVARRGDDLHLELGEWTLRADVAGLSLLEEHTLLKLLLNAHSTLVMGRLGRYQSNVMTWVRPSNRKLIDRTLRYVAHLLQQGGGPALSYEQLAAACFEEMAMLGDNESIVLRTLARLRRQSAGGSDERRRNR